MPAAALRILGDTRPWLFVLFFALVAIGYAQSRPRSVSRGMVAIVPGAMILLTFHGVLSAFGVTAAGLLAWAAGLCAAALVRHFCVSGRGITYSKITRSFYMRGSWRSLGLMMAIFLIQCGVTVALARRPFLARVPLFVGPISLAYGALSGLFLARAVLLWRLARHGAD